MSTKLSDIPWEPCCGNCGERLEGDGYKEVLHCPNAAEATYEFHEPDANPVYCSD